MGIFSSKNRLREVTVSEDVQAEKRQDPVVNITVGSRVCAADIAMMTFCTD